MALDVAAGTFNTRTTTGTTNVSIGFAPVLMFFWGANATASGTFIDSNRIMFGLSYGTAATQNFTFAYNLLDNVTPVVGAYNSYLQNEKCIFMVTEDFFEWVSASVSATDATSFTLNYDHVAPSAYVMNYLALGGTAISNVEFGSFNNTVGVPPATQNVSTVGGFTPNLLLLSRFSVTSSLPSAISSKNRIHLGASDGSNQWSLWARSLTPSGLATDADARFDNNAIIKDGDDSVSATVGFIAGGFQLNWSVRPTLTEYLYYLALNVEEGAVGYFQKDTGAAPDSQAVTGLGFEPGALLQFSTSTTTVNSVTAGAHVAFGMAGASDMGAVSQQSEDGATTTNASALVRNDRSMVKVNNDSKTLEAAATLDSWDADGFTQIWDPNDANASYIGYIAIGATGGGGGGSGGGVGATARIVQPSTIPFMGGRRF